MKVWLQRYILPVLVFVAVSCGLAWFFFEPVDSRATPETWGVVDKRDFSSLVQTYGVLDTKKSYMVASNLKGEIGKIIWLVNDGAYVQKGDELLKFDATPFEERITDLEGTMQLYDVTITAKQQILEWEKNQAEKEIRAAEFKIEAAKLDLEKLVQGEGPLKLAQLRKAFDKSKDKRDKYGSYIVDLEALESQGYNMAEEINKAKTELLQLEDDFSTAAQEYENYKNHIYPTLHKKALKELEQAEIELEQTKKGSVFKIARAQSDVDEIKSKTTNAGRALQKAREQLRSTTMAAPFGGLVIHYEAYRDGQKRKPRVGDQVVQNQPILYLPDITSMSVKTQVREIDLHKVQLGQKCKVTVDAYPGKEFQGNISFIGALATEQPQGPAGKYFQMSIDLLNQDLSLRPGMTARVKIEGELIHQALSVPLQAVFYQDGKSVCYKQNSNGYALVPVALGAQNYQFVEILSGLHHGDRVMMSPPVASLH